MMNVVSEVTTRPLTIGLYSVFTACCILSSSEPDEYLLCQTASQAVALLRQKYIAELN